jgi:sec-independent protein translocase protein TatA
MFRNGIGPGEIILILVVVLLVFGASRLPGVAKALGQSMKIFKNEVKGLSDDAKPSEPSGAPKKDEPDDGSAPKA